MMTRRNFIWSSAISAGILPVADNWLMSFFQTQYSMEGIRSNVGMFIGRGGTIGWYIKGDDICVVDTQFPESAAELVKRIQEKSNKKVNLLINTHHHGDHTAGNIAFKDLVDRVLAHENSKANQMSVAEARGQGESQLYPDTTFDKDWSGKVGDESIRLYYYGPAHTNGDALIHFENANVVHTGDLMFNRRFPFIDKNAGASIANWIDVLVKARETFDHETVYIFGHAGQDMPVRGNAEDLKAMENYLGKLLDFVGTGVKNGQSKDDLLKATVIPGAEEWQGSGIERSINAAWTELVEEK